MHAGVIRLLFLVLHLQMIIYEVDVSFVKHTNDLDTYMEVVYGWCVYIRTSSNGHVVTRDWILCSKYANHSKLNNHHTWGTYITTQ